MSINSMTGFGRDDGHDDHCSWHWEMRCVNGRGLDVRTRLPQGFESLETPVREACKARLGRGNCSIALTVTRESSTTGVRLNEDMFRQVAEIAQRAAEIANSPPPGLDGLLAMRGVIEFAEEEESEEKLEQRLVAIMASFNAVLDDVTRSRAEEGQRLSLELAALLKEIAELVESIESSPARKPEAIATRLREQLARIFEEAPSLDEDRVYQEAALIAAKVDVEEEVARLKAHIAAASDLLKSGEPVGRKFEFLTQEFNREANTICSKSNDTDITRSGLALKAAIDRMREQVQNIE